MSDGLVLGLFGLVLLAILLLLLARTQRSAHGADARPQAVVDGSNVMHWQDNTPRLGPVVAVLDLLDRRGYRAGVIFDANAGYKLTGRYLHDGDFGALLGIGADRVLVVPKGTQADPFLLTHASDTDAIVVSNDRFRDRIAEFPKMGRPGRLVRGGWKDGKPWLDLPEG